MKRHMLSKPSLAVLALSMALFVSACAGDGNAPSQVDPSLPRSLSELPELVGTTYVLDIPGAQWTAPPGLGEDIAKAQTKFAFEVTAVDAQARQITTRLGAAKDGAQDPCNKTYVLPGTLNDNDMTFRLGPMDVQTILGGPESKALATSHGFTISGQIVEQGAGLVSGRLTAELDAREIYPLFYLAKPASGEELCTIMAKAGLLCEPCSYEPGSRLCITFRAEEFAISESRNLSLAEIPTFGPGCL